MGNKLIVCGCNGVGKSTLGKQLAYKLNYKFIDIEDYYFQKNQGSYDYEITRTKEEADSLLLADIKKNDNLVLACVKGDYSDVIQSIFTCAVYITVPKSVSEKRVWERSYQKYGKRILQGGDLYEKEQQFFNVVKQRSEKDIEEWLEKSNLPIIYVDGTKPVSKNVETILRTYIDCYAKF